MWRHAVRHAAAAYQALSQGSGSKRRTHSFDMGLLPSVPELNVQQMPTQASNEVHTRCHLQKLCCKCMMMVDQTAQLDRIWFGLKLIHLREGSSHRFLCFHMLRSSFFDVECYAVIYFT